MAKTKSTSALTIPGVQTLTESAWEAELAGSERNAAAAAGRAGADNAFIKTEGGVFSFNGEALPMPLPVYVLDQVRVNQYYDSAYDPASPTGPTCFAIGREEDDLSPPDDLKGKQAPSCSGCPHNEFGTADRGQGKACRNTLKLALLPAVETDPKKLVQTDPAFISVSPGALKTFAKHARAVERGLGRPLYSVQTLLATEKSGGAWTMTFSAGASASAKIGGVILKRRADVEDDLMTPPQAATSEKRDSKGPTRRVTRKKPVVRSKKAARKSARAK